MNDNHTSDWFSLSSFLKGVGIAILLSGVLILLTSIILYFTPLSEQYTSTASLTILFLSILAGGFFTSKSIGTKGLISGIVVAVLFLSFNLILALIVGSSGFDASSVFIKSATILLGGAIGGVIGVGFSDK